MASLVVSIILSFESQASGRLYFLSFLIGGFSLSLYSLVVALTNDHLRPREIIPASGTVILIAGLTSVTGPITAIFWLEIFGLQSFFILLASCLLLLGGISIWRVLTIAPLPAEYKVQSTLQAATVPVGTILHVEEEIPSDDAKAA